MAVLSAEKALEELRSKKMEEIERITAITWGGRALASYQLAQEQRDVGGRFRHFYEGENYRQEALEHASMAEDGGELLRQVHDEIETVRQQTLKGLKSQAAPAR